MTRQKPSLRFQAPANIRCRRFDRGPLSFKFRDFSMTLSKRFICVGLYNKNDKPRYFDIPHQVLRCFCLVVLVASFIHPVAAQPAPEELTPNEPTLDDEGCVQFIEPGSSKFDISTAPNPVANIQFPEDAVVGNIVFTRYPIFNANDSNENNALFSLVDFLHIDTQPRVIRAQLLFQSGERLNMRELEEAARALRESEYFYDARIWPYRMCGTRVDIEVLTREVWTLSGGASFSRSGGADEQSVSIRDSNIFGRGETLSLESTSSTDRDSFEVLYFDPNVVGSRHELNLFYADSDDGSQKILDLQRPFYSLDTHAAWGVRYDDHDRVDNLFERGEDVAGFETQSRQREIYYGESNGWDDGVTKRWFLGFRWQKESFLAAEDEVLPAVFPQDREINYPFVGYNYIEENFIKTSNLNQMHRIEDFNLGKSWGLRLGFAEEEFGSDQDRTVFSANWRDAWQLSDSTIMQLKLNASGFWQNDNDKGESVVLESYLRYYDGLNKNQGTYIALDMKYARNLPVHEQLLLGAEENLRGYPARYQNGDRSFVLSVERRYYTDWHLFRLLRVGGAVFFDVGRAWEPDDINDDASGVLADVGFGLRIASSRAQTKRTLHVDVAFPLEDLDDVDSYEVVITAKQSF
ncbi:BamA/TamA family outer membrane protein [Aurantivibrio infirmus]